MVLMVVNYMYVWLKWLCGKYDGIIVINFVEGIMKNYIDVRY